MPLCRPARWLPALPHRPLLSLPPPAQLCSPSGPPFRVPPALALQPLQPPSAHPQAASGVPPQGPSHRGPPTSPNWTTPSVFSGLTTPLSILCKTWVVSVCSLAKGVSRWTGVPILPPWGGPRSFEQPVPSPVPAPWSGPDSLPFALCPLGKDVRLLSQGRRPGSRPAAVGART